MDTIIRSKNIVINDVATSGGGKLSILRQLLDSINQYPQKDSVSWIVFVSNGLVDKYANDRIQVVHISAKKWSRRIIWDTIGIKWWLYKRKIRPDLAISLMTVGFKFLKVPQLVYLHQALPLSDYRNFKWYEIKYRGFSWFMKRWMRWSISPNSFLVVQISEMRRAASRLLNIDLDRAFIFTPSSTLESSLETISNSQSTNRIFTYRLFYPVVPSVSYKNIDLLIRCFSIIKERSPSIYKSIKLILTISMNDETRLVKSYVKLAKDLHVDEKIHWLGYIDSDELHKQYENSDALVFPSSVETFGLPLLEAAMYGKKIFAIDKPFVSDVLSTYSGYEMIRKDADVWASKIIKYYEKDQREVFEKITSENGDWSAFMELINKIIATNENSIYN
jgi:glycosyltransferase involved in cell wall biosynthesis